MKRSIKTFLKHPIKDNSNRSANPAVIRASTILFNSMQELYNHEKKIKKHQKVSHYSYGRYGSSTTIELENILKELEQAFHVFLTGTGFGGVALAIMSICRPEDEILVIALPPPEVLLCTPVTLPFALWIAISYSISSQPFVLSA